MFLTVTLSSISHLQLEEQSRSTDALKEEHVTLQDKHNSLCQELSHCQEQLSDIMTKVETLEKEKAAFEQTLDKERAAFEQMEAELERKKSDESNKKPNVKNECDREDGQHSVTPCMDGDGDCLFSKEPMQVQHGNPDANDSQALQGEFVEAVSPVHKAGQLTTPMDTGPKENSKASCDISQPVEVDIIAPSPEEIEETDCVTILERKPEPTMKCSGGSIPSKPSVENESTGSVQTRNCRQETSMPPTREVLQKGPPPIETPSATCASSNEGTDKLCCVEASASSEETSAAERGDEAVDQGGRDCEKQAQ